MKVNNNLLTLNQLISNSTYTNVYNYTNSLAEQLVVGLLSTNAKAGVNNQTVICNILLQEFLLRIPYEQNLDNLTIRFVGILNKYSINILNYLIKYQQLQNFYTMLQNNQARTVNYTTNLTSDITTSNTTNQASAEAFNPVDNSLVTMNLSKAESNVDVTADGVSTASTSNSNFDTSQNQTQETKHNMNEADITIYNSIKFEMDNLLQPVLTALNSLFYIFETTGDDYIW